MSTQDNAFSREINFDRPSLLLDFVNTGSIDSRLHTTRTGTSSVCTETGFVKVLNKNTAGIHYKPSDHGGINEGETEPRECLGLQIDPPRVNEYCDTAFTHLIAGAGDSSLSNATASLSGSGPDGTNDTALKLVEAGDSDKIHKLAQTWTAPHSGTAARIFTASAWVKKDLDTNNNRAICIEAATTHGAVKLIFDLKENFLDTFATGTGVAYDSGKESFANGWTRIFFTATLGTEGNGNSSTSTTMNFIIAKKDSTPPAASTEIFGNYILDYNGSTSNAWYIWGPQFETALNVDLGDSKKGQGWQRTGFIRNETASDHNAIRSEQLTTLSLDTYKEIVNTFWAQPDDTKTAPYQCTVYAEYDMSTEQKFDTNISNINKSIGVMKFCNRDDINNERGWGIQVDYASNAGVGKLNAVNRDFVFRARNLTQNSNIPGATIKVTGFSSDTAANQACIVTPAVNVFALTLNNTSTKLGQRTILASRRAIDDDKPNNNRTQSIAPNDPVLVFGGTTTALKMQGDNGGIPYCGWIKKVAIWPKFYINVDIPDGITADATLDIVKSKLQNLSQGF